MPGVRFLQVKQKLELMRTVGRIQELHNNLHNSFSVIPRFHVVSVTNRDVHPLGQL